MKKMLERNGYIVTARTSSIEALEAFRKVKENIDLVITDMTMPKMTGKELSTKIKKIKPEIPVIICTGFSDKLDEKEAKKTGIDGFINKPVTGSEFSQIIRKVLDKKKKYN